MDEQFHTTDILYELEGFLGGGYDTLDILDGATIRNWDSHIQADLPNGQTFTIEVRELPIFKT